MTNSTTAVRCEICGKPEVGALIPRSKLRASPGFRPERDGISLVCSCPACAARCDLRLPPALEPPQP